MKNIGLHVLAGLLLPLAAFGFLAGCGRGGGAGGDSGVLLSSADIEMPLCVGTGSGTAVLSWVPPTTNEDGSPATLKEFRIYCEGSHGSLLFVWTIASSETTVVVNDLPPGTHYFAITAVSMTGAESVLSNVETKVIE